MAFIYPLVRNRTVYGSYIRIMYPIVPDCRGLKVLKIEPWERVERLTKEKKWTV